MGYEHVNSSEIPKHFLDILPKLQKVRSWAMHRLLSPAEQMSADVRPATSEAPEDQTAPEMPMSSVTFPAAPGNQPPPVDGGGFDFAITPGFNPEEPFSFDVTFRKIFDDFLP
ncbi:MAG: hypothetical protein LBB05_02855 [Puniceicoccales bacterium]|nr:hypothetical protein [Puniceicoccales bacterium]